MIGRHHLPQRRDERSLRIGQEGCDTRERLLFLRIEDMKYCADQERVGRFFPVVATLQSSFGVNQNIGDILNVENLVRAAPNLQPRILPGRTDDGRMEKPRVWEARAPAGGEHTGTALAAQDVRRTDPDREARVQE